MTKPLLAQPGTVMAAIGAMEQIISRKLYKPLEQQRLEVIKKVLIRRCRMKDIKQLTDRVALYDDSQEIAASLGVIAKSMPLGDSYFIKEAETQILGLYELATDLANALKNSRN